MEEIKQFLIKDEQILWEKYEIKNYLGRFLIAIFFLILIFVAVGFFSWFSIFVSVFFYIFAGGVIVYATINTKRTLKKYNLRLTDLIHYNAYILTNKRWIQKNNRILVELDQLGYPVETLKPVNNVLFIPLKLFDNIAIRKIREKYKISIFFNSPNKDRILLLVTLRLELEEYNHLISNLKQVLNTNKIEFKL